LDGDILRDDQWDRLRPFVPGGYKGKRGPRSDGRRFLDAVHFLRNALDHLPRKADDDCLQELRWLYDRRSVEEARRGLAAWITKWEGRYPRLVAWAEETIE
jgi:transposase-like protein